MSFVKARLKEANFELPLGRSFDIDLTDVPAAVIPDATSVSIKIHYRLNADDVNTLVILNLPPRRIGDYRAGGPAVALLTFRPTLVGFYQATLSGLIVVGGEANSFSYRAAPIHVRCQAGS